eukprot:GHVP01066405.1.p2 GENE.GHVP01066405.1~~GHVP01066405.1.p2  ORF type:complete len:108 (-),score=8.49 GHVP01066405.1:127-450(-)
MTEWINTPSGWLTLIVAASTWHKNGVSADTESSSKESFVQTQVDYKLFIMSKSCSLARIWRCYASSPPEASSEEACCTKGTSQAFQGCGPASSLLSKIEKLLTETWQ